MRQKASFRFRAGLALLPMLGSLAPAQAAPGIHPGYQASSLPPSGFEPSVGDLAWWPDGRLAVLTLLIKDHESARAGKAGQAVHSISVGAETRGIFFWEGRGPTGLAREKLILPKGPLAMIPACEKSETIGNP
jgi:hypothetical protein